MKNSLKHLLGPGMGTVLLCGALVMPAGAYDLSPLTTFGGGDGWKAPGEGGYQFLGINNLERGLAYNPVTDHLYLVSRNAANGGINLRILDPLTGADLGALNKTGISGGDYPVNMVAVGGDGAIYVANMTVSATTANPFKVYKWADEAAAPSVFYSGVPTANQRIGDTLDAIGSGTGTRLVAGFRNTRNYAIVTNAGVGGVTVASFAAAPPNDGDFSYGLTFAGSISNVFGTQGGASGARYTAFSGTTGTLLGTSPLTTGTERPMDYTVLDGRPLLATVDTANSLVRVYDASDPLNLVLLDADTTTTIYYSNPQLAGSVAWGKQFYEDGVWKQYLYAMNGNNGIQAFIFAIPEPGPLGLSLVGLAVLGAAQWRRRRAPAAGCGPAAGNPRGGAKATRFVI